MDHWPHRTTSQLGQLTITRPELLKPFAEHNRRHPEQAVRPGSFVSVCYPKPFARADPVRLFAPYTAPERALDEDWYDLRTGHRYGITTRGLLGDIIPGVVPVKSYGDIATSYANRPESKFAHNSAPCLPNSTGTLARRHVHATSVEPLGKEANLLNRRVEGTGTRDELQQIYTDNALTDLEIEQLFTQPRPRIAATAGISERALRDILSRRARPRPAVAEALRRSL